MNMAEARTFAQDKMSEHGLTTWKFVIDQRPKNRSGQCRYSKREIALSAWMLQTGEKADAKARDTILHEVAHALAGPGTKHGPIWRAWATRIGARPNRVFNAEDNGLVRPAHRYQATCAGCGHVHGFHRRTKCAYTCKCGHGETLKFQRVR